MVQVKKSSGSMRKHPEHAPNDDLVYLPIFRVLCGNAVAKGKTLGD
jgi:hypothetical protein